MANMSKKTKPVSDKPNILFVQLSNTVDQAPFIDQTRNKSKDWVFFGKDNLFPQRLVDYYDSVNIHRLCVDKTVKFIAGEGLIFEGNTEQAQKFINDSTSNNIDSYLSRLAFDEYMFGGQYYNIVWNNGGKIEEWKPVDFTTIRVGRLEDNKITNYWHSLDWKIANKTRNFTGEKAFAEPKSIPIFNKETIRDADSRENGQILSIENTTRKAGKLFYPEPNYLACTFWLDICAKIADLHKNNLDNGMVGSTHMHLYEDLSNPTKRRKVEDGINNKFAGTNNAGTIIVTWSTETEKTPQVNTLPTSNTDKMASFLKEAANSEIINAHNIPPILAGKEVKTGLSGQSLGIRESMELFQSTQIRPHQQKLEMGINKLLETNGINAKTIIKPLSPIRFMASEESLLQVLGNDLFAKLVLGIDLMEEKEKAGLTQQDDDIQQDT